MGVSERDIEDGVRNVRFPDSGHKDRLRKRLFAADEELSPEVLEGVRGGAVPPDVEQWKPWKK